MIRYALICQQQHQFEAWFSSSADFEVQNRQQFVQCPFCDSTNITKQIMSPAVRGGKKSKETKSPEQILAEYASIVREKIRSTHDYVGDKFADQARAMHLGESEEKPIYGEVNTQQARQLKDEGIPAEPLPAPFNPGKPNKVN